MKTTHAISALLLIALLAPAVSFAAEEPEIERRIAIKIMADDELVEIDADNLAIGETRQSYTDSGKEVLVTRTEDGYRIEVDGEEVDVELPGGEGHHAFMHMESGEGKKVVIRKFEGEGEGGHGFHFIHGGEGEGHHWVQKGDGEDVNVVIERFSAADRLAESVVLDDLSEEKRQEILDALREAEPHQIHKQMRVRIEEEIHEEHEEEQ